MNNQGIREKHSDGDCKKNRSHCYLRLQYVRLFDQNSQKIMDDLQEKSFQMRDLDGENPGTYVETSNK